MEGQPANEFDVVAPQRLIALSADVDHQLADVIDRADWQPAADHLRMIAGKLAALSARISDRSPLQDAR